MSDPLMGTGNAHLHHGDCIAVMESLPDASVDLVLVDPPYGTTACQWDTSIPLDKMWAGIWRVLKPHAPAVIFGQEPFSSALRMSSVREFKYDLYWRKTRPSGFTNAKLKPLKDIEVISVFSTGTTANGSKRNMPYFPQNVGEGISWSRPQRYMAGDRGVNPARASHKLSRKTGGSNYPRQVLDFANPNKNLVHPTQKPVDLMEYLVATYSLTNDTVLDFAMGSGSTGVAAINLGRKFIGIEKDQGYAGIAQERISGAVRSLAA